MENVAKIIQEILLNRSQQKNMDIYYTEGETIKRLLKKEI